ncbi:hypothetical protein HY68_00115 [Streptomyces sp. AcH 505]|uniref:hypothetical protein n=1 Tax=Streptomyces sp. AcH 505 TaxID=352211 RepID=UPI0005920EC4|nr:hypothetical protein HY68_00115 [Streptomyces sp. AcH 505]
MSLATKTSVSRAINAGSAARNPSPNQRVSWKGISESSPFALAAAARPAQSSRAVGPYQAVVSTNSAPWLRSWYRAANAWATQPPMEQPTTVAAAQPR